MNSTIHLLDVVALAEELPTQGLSRGQVGTVVEELAPDAFLVEFSDDDGRTYAMLPLLVEGKMREYCSTRIWEIRNQ